MMMGSSHCLFGSNRTSWPDSAQQKARRHALHASSHFDSERLYQEGMRKLDTTALLVGRVWLSLAS
eukprot:1227415-Amphidinium_carterae.1